MVLHLCPKNRYVLVFQVLVLVQVLVSVSFSFIPSFSFKAVFRVTVQNPSMMLDHGHILPDRWISPFVRSMRFLRDPCQVWLKCAVHPETILTILKNGTFDLPHGFLFALRAVFCKFRIGSNRFGFRGKTFKCFVADGLA